MQFPVPMTISWGNRIVSVFHIQIFIWYCIRCMDRSVGRVLLVCRKICERWLFASRTIFFYNLFLLWLGYLIREQKTNVVAYLAIYSNEFNSLPLAAMGNSRIYSIFVSYLLVQIKIKEMKTRVYFRVREFIPFVCNFFIPCWLLT